MHRLRPLVTSALVIGLAAAFLLGCGPEEEEITKHEQKSGKVPVDLPAKPNLESILGADKTLPDGSMTVIGLILDRSNYFGKQVQVRGIVREASLDCPFLTDPTYEKPKEGEREQLRKCEGLYVTIADNPTHPKELVLVQYNPYLHPHLEPGTEIVAKGIYDTHGAGFIRPRDGLVVVEEVLNLAVDEEGNFYSDPAKVAEIKAEQAAAEQLE